MFKTSTNNNFDELSPTQEYKSIRQSFANGFITNIFNIKAFIFFISLFTILIDSIDGIFFYLYPIYFAVTTSLWFMLLSYLLTVNKKINIHNNKLINRLMAFFLLIIGLYLIINTAYEYF
jgi:threonine/homoserine/homoserine lactone efflux protein